MLVLGSSISTPLPLPRPGVAEPDDLVASVSNLGEVELGVGDDLPDVEKELPNALVPPIHRVAPEHRERRVPLHFGVKLGKESFDVSAVPRFQCALERVDVLLRHRPPSISRRRAPVSGAESAASP
jgi:hypothetical protein